MNPQFPERVEIFEVGPRDGLQNEKKNVPTDRKAAFIEKLAQSGLSRIEVTSFVSPQAVPQLADADRLIPALPKIPGVRYFALVPNPKGLERALISGVHGIAVFTAASGTFVRKNLHQSIQGSLEVFREVVREALASHLEVRGYVSTAFVCPYEGEIAKEKTCEVAERLLELGVSQVSAGDTIGAASPKDVFQTIGFLLTKIPSEKIALHFHDTYGTALANVVAALQLGITTFDSSAGGLGGCPYAPGASGNVATEDLVYMLHRMGIQTGVDLEKVFQASNVIAGQFGQDLPSKQWKRLKSRIL